MARKARRIKRRVSDMNHAILSRHSIYYHMLALQLSTQRQQSWFDILPEDVKNMIWKEYFKAPLLQIQEFGMYRGIIRIYMQKHIHRNYYDDVKYSRDGRHVALRHAANMKYYHIVSEQEHTHDNIVSLFSSYDIHTKERTYYKIFNEAIVTDVRLLYGLCKAVPENWDYIGRAEDIVAGKYTYN